MEITMEQVERLREKASVSYAQAKEALEYSEGNLLDALIYLEEKGTVPRPEGARWSGQEEKSAQPTVADLVIQEPPKQEKHRRPRTSLREWLRRLYQALVDNELEVWRRDEPVTTLPVLILVILLVFAFWVTIPLLLVGLFFGFRYRFSGPDLERDSINGVMENVANTAADMGRQVMDELHAQHDKHAKNKTEE